MCIAERVGFMAPFEYVREANHPYNRGPETSHGHFKPTALRHPPYSAPAVPFAWMLREAMETMAEEHALDVQAEREPDLGFKTQWVQEHLNQTALARLLRRPPQARTLALLLLRQAGAVRGGRSRWPHPDRRRARAACRRPQEYDYTTKDLDGKLRSMLWERMVQHSIRPDFKDGFLLPYHAAIAKAAEDPEFDPAEIAAFSPADRLLEFSHASQLVSHDGAIASLLACTESLRKAKGVLPGPWDQCLQWIDARLGELWKARGPCPGLGSALSAFGLEFGTFVAQALAEKAGDNADPWPLVDKMFADPKKHLPAPLAEGIGKTMRSKWSRLPDERRALLKLVSRFEITREQATALYVQEERAKAGIDIGDAAILGQPVPALRTDAPDRRSRQRLDGRPRRLPGRGHPQEASAARAYGTGRRDRRSPRARAHGQGARRRGRQRQHAPPAGPGRARYSWPDAAAAVRGGCRPDERRQGRLRRFRRRARRWRTALRPCSWADWRRWGRPSAWRSTSGSRASGWPSRPTGASCSTPTWLRRRSVIADELEESARAEKTAALDGTGGGAALRADRPCGHRQDHLALGALFAPRRLRPAGILLLAPTGKARVRMEQSTKGLKLKGYTIAQFLSPHRYDGSTGRYRLSDQTDGGRRADGHHRRGLDADRGDARGADPGAQGRAPAHPHRRSATAPADRRGRPFVDIVKHLAPEGVTERFPRVGPGYAELTIRRRQAGEDREDLQLAEWFSGSPIAPGEDDVFDKVVRTGQSRARALRAMGDRGRSALACHRRAGRVS